MASLASLLNPSEADAISSPSTHQPPPRKGSLAPAVALEPSQQQSADSSTPANALPAPVDVSSPTLPHSNVLPSANLEEAAHLVRRQSHESTEETLSSHAGQVSSATQQQQSASLEAPPAQPPAAVDSPAITDLTTLNPPAAAHSESIPSSAAMEVEPPLQPSSPVEGRRDSDADTHALKAVAALKSESNQRPQSPLRESSIPVPSTEDVAKDEPSASSKKRPAPAKTKKGTASTVKRDRAPAAKKRKTESKRADTPSSRASKAAGKGASAKGTPINSSPAPSTRSYSAEPQEDQDDDDEEMDDEGRSQDGDLYCICHKPDNGQFMIGCDGTCDDWFHGKCVGIPERDKNLIDKYICPGCTTAGVGRTTWKRMCRRSGCRQPAKTNKSKTGASGSKYCSEECGVLYFRDMVANTRGAEESASRRAARKKGGVDSSDKQEDDLGARGGALAAGEVKALLNASGTVEEFRKLGDGVLSPPTTPDGKENNDEPEYTEWEAQELGRIDALKENARQRHNLLKDRMKFVTMAKQAASRVATERELKPKEYCGYDPRIEWSEERFQIWRNGPSGQQAFELDTLATEKAKDAEEMADDDDATPDICDRKKCARHMEWSKLAVDDLRFEMSDNGDRMRSLDREEHNVKEGAALRSKTGGAHYEGSVEIHGSVTAAAAALPEREEASAGSIKAADSPEAVPTFEDVAPVAVDVA